MTIAEIQEILGRRITYKNGWVFYLGNIHAPEALYLQVRVHQGGCRKDLSGRRWLLADHMTELQIVQAALRAVMEMEEQSVQVNFHYQGRPFFSVEAIDLEKMMAICFGRPQACPAVPPIPISKADIP